MVWELKKLGDVCEILDSLRKPITKKDRISGGYPYYGATGIVDWVNDYIFDEKLVLVGEDGAKWSSGDNTAFIVEGKIWVNNHAHVIRPITNIVTHEWLTYHLVHLNLTKWVTGLTVPKLNQANLRSIPIPVPPLPEQKRIVAKLDKSFAEIDDCIRKTKDKLLHIDALAYKSIEEGLLKFENNYETKSLSETTTIQPNKKLALEKIGLKSDVSFMGMDSLGIEEQYSSSDEIRGCDEVYKSYQYFENDDVLLAKITPCFENGKLSIASNLMNNIGFGSSEFVVIRPKKPLSKEFIYFNLLRKKFRDEGKKNMTGAVGHKRVTKDYIANKKISIPPIDEQNLFTNRLEKIWANTKLIKNFGMKKLKELALLKSAILKKELQTETT